MRGDGPAEAKRVDAARRSLQDSLLVLVLFREIGKGTGTCQEGGLSAGWTGLLGF